MANSGYDRAKVPMVKGLRFVRLEVIDPTPIKKNRNHYCLCQCDCGTKKIININEMRRGKVKSCGCLGAIGGAKTHGKTKTRIYRIWISMKSRCNSPKSGGYEYYGARGIKIHKKWETFEGFYEDMGDPPSPLHSLDRINNNGDYELSNCRWATPKQQSRNKRTSRLIEWEGQKLTLADWSERYNLNDSTVLCRLKRGWTLDQAFTTRAIPRYTRNKEEHEK